MILRSPKASVEISLNSSATSFDFARVQFESRMKGPSGSWSAKVGFSNPSDSMVGMISGSGAIVRVLAGYETTGVSEVSSGNVVKGSVVNKRAGEPVLQFETNSGSGALARLVTGQVRGSGTAADVAEQIRVQLGLSTGEISDRMRQVQFSRGYVYAGTPRSILSELCDSADCVFDTDGGRLVIRGKGEPKSQSISELWSSNTGLMDITSPGGSGEITATALLRPSLRPGDIVKLESSWHTGSIVAREVTHKGDTHGDIWLTTVLGFPLV